MDQDQLSSERRDCCFGSRMRLMSFLFCDSIDLYNKKALYIILQWNHLVPPAHHWVDLSHWQPIRREEGPSPE